MRHDGEQRFVGGSIIFAAKEVSMRGNFSLLWCSPSQYRMSQNFLKIVGATIAVFMLAIWLVLDYREAAIVPANHLAINSKQEVTKYIENDEKTRNIHEEYYDCIEDELSVDVPVLNLRLDAKRCLDQYWANITVSDDPLVYYTSSGSVEGHDEYEGFVTCMQSKIVGKFMFYDNVVESRYKSDIQGCLALYPDF